MNMKETLHQQRVIVICRRLYGDQLFKLSQALHEGGLDLMEVTFDQSDPDCIEKTSNAISSLKQRFGDHMHFGAGTVLTEEQVISARQAGARYIISPGFDAAVVTKTKQEGLLSIPGAMTPSEIMAAWNCGADYVKLFPAASLGLSYIKDILAPISHVPLVATAGVKEENFGDFLKLGFAGAGISGRLADKTCIAAGDYAEITRRAKAFCAIARGGD